MYGYGGVDGSEPRGHQLQRTYFEAEPSHGPPSSSAPSGARATFESDLNRSAPAFHPEFSLIHDHHQAAAAYDGQAARGSYDHRSYDPTTVVPRTTHSSQHTRATQPTGTSVEGVSSHARGLRQPSPEECLGRGNGPHMYDFPYDDVSTRRALRSPDTRELRPRYGDYSLANGHDDVFDTQFSSADVFVPSQQIAAPAAARTTRTFDENDVHKLSRLSDKRLRNEELLVLRQQEERIKNEERGNEVLLERDERGACGGNEQEESQEERKKRRRRANNLRRAKEKKKLEERERLIIENPASPRASAPTDPIPGEAGSSSQTHLPESMPMAMPGFEKWCEEPLEENSDTALEGLLADLHRGSQKVENVPPRHQWKWS